MTTPLGGRFYHVYTKQSADSVFAVPILAGHKVLCGGVRAHGTTGILSSFYDARQEAWVVQHDPVDDGACVVLRVVTLVDPDDMYDVRVSEVSLTDDMLPEEVGRIAEHTEARDRRIAALSSTDAFHAEATLERQMQQCQNRPGRRDVLSLICPVLQGYTLTGGGFASSYPVLASTAYMNDVCHDEWLSRASRESLSSLSLSPPSSVRSLSVTTNANGALNGPVHTGQNRKMLRCASGVGDAETPKITPTAWSVTAAENRSLTCYAIGIRIRSRSHEVVPHGVCNVHLARCSLGNVSLNKTPTVKVHHGPDGRWGIELPPPHGNFYFAFIASCVPNPVMLTTFYR